MSKPITCVLFMLLAMPALLEARDQPILGATTSPTKASAALIQPERYSRDPNVRMAQLLNDSNQLRRIRIEKARIWATNQPSCLSFERLNGAIGP
jgi:hypothetical protein